MAALGGLPVEGVGFRVSDTGAVRERVVVGVSIPLLV